MNFPEKMGIPPVLTIISVLLAFFPFTSFPLAQILFSEYCHFFIGDEAEEGEGCAGRGGEVGANENSNFGSSVGLTKT